MKKRIIIQMLIVCVFIGCTTKAKEKAKEAPLDLGIYTSAPEAKEIIEQIQVEAKRHGYSSQDVPYIKLIEELDGSYLQVAIAEVVTGTDTKVIQLMKKDNWKITNVSSKKNYLNSPIQTIKHTEISKQTINKLQENAQKQSWRKDPEEVLKKLGGKYGFSRFYDVFEKIEERMEDKKSIQKYAVIHGEKTYLVTVIQPGLQGKEGIWIIQSVQESDEG